MTRRLLYKALIAVVEVFSLACCQAQSSFSHTSDLPPIPKAGFYKIVLSPAIVARCMEGLPDIRIFDEHSNQVPFISKSDQQGFEENNFIELPVLSVKKEADRQTHVVIKNLTDRTINEILLIIKNTDANRTAILSGSDDTTQWFVIKENILLNNFFDAGTDRFIQALTFPGSSYKYFKIIMTGKDLLPVNIIKAGIYQNRFRTGMSTALPAPSVFQRDSLDKHSYVTLHFNDQYQIDKLQLSVSGAKYFRRQMTIFKKGDRTNVRVGDFTLSSDAATFFLKVKSSQLILVISNDDNPPLKITSANALQHDKYLLTYLETGHRYRLLYGDAKSNFPNYDLTFFSDSIGNNPVALTPGPVVQNDEARHGLQRSINNTALLWIIIATVLVLLLALTFKMTREINRNESR